MEKRFREVEPMGNKKSMRELLIYDGRISHEQL
jgi:hypothetical protein